MVSENNAYRETPGHRGNLRDTKNNFDVIECEVCGFCHVIPIPSEEELEYVYKEDYYSTEKPLYIDQYIEDLDWWLKTYNERYELIERHITSERSGKPRILDIGSGPGYFLQAGDVRGWDVVGLEPSGQAAEYSRSLGVTIHQTTFNPETAGQFSGVDVVHMCNVLEHLPHPRQTLELVHDILEEGGLTFIVVPNDYNVFQTALQDTAGFAPWWVAPPHHINYFNYSSLENLLTDTGFEVVYKSCSFPMELFLMMGDNYVGNDPLGRECHAKRKRLERFLWESGLNDLKQGLYEYMAGLGVGREIIMVARKTNAHGEP